MRQVSISTVGLFSPTIFLRAYIRIILLIHGLKGGRRQRTTGIFIRQTKLSM